MINSQPLPAWAKKRRVVNGSSSLVMVTLEKPTFTALRFFISVYEPDMQRFFTCNMSVNKSEPSPKDTLTEKINDTGLNLTLISEYVGTQYRLRLDNNESFPLNVSYSYITLK